MSSEKTTLKSGVDKYIELLKTRYQATDTNQLKKINKEIQNIYKEIFKNDHTYSIDELIKAIKGQNINCSVPINKKDTSLVVTEVGQNCTLHSEQFVLC